MDIYGSLEGSTGLTFFGFRSIIFCVSLFCISLGRVPTWCVLRFAGDKSLSYQEFFGFLGRVECNLTTLRSFVATAADLWRTNFEVMTRTTLATLSARKLVRG